MNDSRKLEYLGKAVTAAPNRREVWLEMASYYYGVKDWNGLLWACGAGLERSVKDGSYLDHADSWGHKLLDFGSVAAANLGWYERAADWCEQARALKPSGTTLLSDLESIKSKTRETARASGVEDRAAAHQPIFTQDWFSHNVPLWETCLRPLRDKPVNVLEIGVFEGRSAGGSGKCTDARRSSANLRGHVYGRPEHPVINVGFSDVEQRFLHNIHPYRHRVSGHHGPSQQVLRQLPLASFDFIYLDGSHEAPDVLSDAVQAWPLLKVGGLLAFDDYEWNYFSEPERCPKLAIDAFLAVMNNCYRVLDKTYQVWLEKVK